MSYFISSSKQQKTFFFPNEENEITHQHCYAFCSADWRPGDNWSATRFCVPAPCLGNTAVGRLMYCVRCGRTYHMNICPCVPERSALHNQPNPNTSPLCQSDMQPRRSLVADRVIAHIQKPMFFPSLSPFKLHFQE